MRLVLLTPNELVRLIGRGVLELQGNFLGRGLFQEFRQSLDERHPLLLGIYVP